MAFLPLIALACESRQPEVASPDPPLRGARLIVGTALEGWSLLSIPRGGGVVEARSLTDPQRVVSTGDAPVPATASAHVLADGLVVLHGLDGTVYTYDASSDELVRVGEVASDAVWTSGGAVGLFRSPEGSLLEVAREGVWRYSLNESIAWAAPVDAGVFVVLDRASGERPIWLLERGGDTPSASGEAEVSGPGAVTAWGSRVILSSPERRDLVVLTAAQIERTARLALDGTILAVTTSPSTHEIYVTLDDPPRLDAVNRFDLSVRTLMAFNKPVEELRPSQFGEALLAYDGSAVYRIPIGGTVATRVPSAWRSDLPIGLPDGSVLAADDASVAIAGAGGVAPLEGADVDAWWLVVPWNPASAQVMADRITGEIVESPTDGEEGRLSMRDAERASDLEAAAPGLRDRPATPTDVSGPPPGFYAIVGSARQQAGIRSLVSSLAGAGFSTQIQTFPDEAGQTWYRGLVGPYGTRSEAEAAARQLLRERRLEAWVTEIGAQSRLDESPI